MISQVTIKITKNGEIKDVWFLFETEHEDLFEFNEDLATDGTVYGHRIDTEYAGPGKRRETGRYECIISRETIVTVIPSQSELLPPEAEAVRA
jgi:hypothetical protein